nr:HAD family hydrolase [Bacteroidota bacterium]
MNVYQLPDKIRVLVFDIDMTLYTSYPYLESQIRLLTQRLADHFGWSYDEATEKIKQSKAEYAEKNNGRNLSIGNVYLTLGISIKTSSEWRRELLNPEAFLKKDDALISALRRLKEKYHLAAATNNSTEVGKRTLKALGIFSLFDIVVGLDISGESKPTIVPFRIIADHYHVPLNEMVSIGDRYEVDLELPLQYGMGGVLVDGVEDVYGLGEVL